MNIKTLKAACVGLILSVSGLANAGLIAVDFEGVTSSIMNISPGSPYTEEGFTFTPISNQSAIFDSSEQTMIGNSTDFFGFDSANIISLTYISGIFNLDSLLLGPFSYQTIPEIDVSITGFYSGGGAVAVTYSDISTATTANLGWNNLVRVDFSANDMGAIDNLNLSTSSTSVPEPTTLAIFALGIMGLASRRFKK